MGWNVPDDYSEDWDCGRQENYELNELQDKVDEKAQHFQRVIYHLTKKGELDTNELFDALDELADLFDVRIRDELTVVRDRQFDIIDPLQYNKIFDGIQ